MLGFFRERAKKKRQAKAYEMGQQVAARIAGVVDAHFDPRLSKLSYDVLEVLRGRLKTIYDDPEHDPKKIVRIELEIFVDNLNSFVPRLMEEARSVPDINKWTGVIEQLDVKELVDQYLKKKLDAAILAMTKEGVILAADTISQIENLRP